MAIDSVADGDTVLAADVNQYKEALEGTRTVSYSLASAASTSFVVKLADNAGARKVSITDSDGVEVASIDSNGNATFGGITLTSFTLPTSANPTQTQEASMVWDTTLNLPTFGDGTSTQDWPPGPVIKVKTADETVNSTTTVQSDDHLTFTALASTKYLIEMVLYVTSNTTADVKFQMSVPSGTTGWAVYSCTGSDTLTWSDVTAAQGVGLASGTTMVVTISMYLSVSSTAGAVTLQWAQNTSTAVDTKLLIGSNMRVYRII